MGLVIASVHEKREEYRKILLATGAPERFPLDAEARAGCEPERVATFAKWLACRRRQICELFALGSSTVKTH
jgi:hypothetical protein